MRQRKPMNTGHCPHGTSLLLAMAVCIPIAAATAADHPPKAPSGVRIWHTNYNGWSNSIVLNNGTTEAVVVPQLGRIMQFRFTDASTGPFWENPKLTGSSPKAGSWDTPGSFGGDKVWPAPQSLWNWPPPRAYDSLGATGNIDGLIVTLVFPPHPVYGRCIREITLDHSAPVLRVVNRIEKPTNPKAPLSAWTITQVKDPVAVFLHVPKKTTLTNSYVLMSTRLPEAFSRGDGSLSLKRGAKDATKVGSDGDAILWAGPDTMLLITCPRMADVPASGYADGGCSVEVYTNPDAAPYVEMETLGPLCTFERSSYTQTTNTYTLLRRSRLTPEQEAHQIFSRLNR